jgi:hypothetical protein
VQVEGAAGPEMLLYLKEARQKCAEANRKFGSNLNVTVISHTHHARIAIHDTPE